jgi:hypothetical protein
MSNRTLIEINHDLPFGDTGLLVALERYRCSASREAADHLFTHYGVKVIGMRHHSGNFILDGEPDGFPVSYLTPATREG